MLANPMAVFPNLKGTIFETFPYLLPNLVCAIVVVFGLTVGILFLEETHEDRKYDHDRGREAGQWIVHKLWKQGPEELSFTEKDASLDEMRSMLDHDDLNAQAYQSTDTSPTLCSTRTSISEPPLFSLDKEARSPPPVRQAFTKQVCLNVVCYGILAL